MPLPGETYSVTDDWRLLVLAELAATEKRPERSKSWLALQVTNLRGVKTSRSVINDLLNVKGKRKALRSPLVAYVNQALGLPPPVSDAFTEDEVSLVMAYRALDESGQRGVWNDIGRRQRPNPEMGRVAQVEASLGRAVAKVAAPAKKLAARSERSDQARNIRK